MSIKELPRATSRLLSSSQVLATPASLVKELLDNALDAKATSVDIVIAANTLDKIEVRDNGHGITPEDLSVIGKRGYTSKLRNFDELKTLGGLSLGFRGEALASAVELGDVSITTRIEGEVVATAIKLNAHGGIGGQTLVSHPVGTTVCVTNFFSRLPVRKQTALKDSKKTISKIKEILQAYALARLNVRLTLKVLKAENSNWSFAPRANEGTREIVSQVIGRDTAAQCVEMISTLLIPSQVDAGAGDPSDDTSATPDGRKSPGTLPQSSFVIQALLPRPDADFTKVSGAQYVSIDSRPVSSARGSSKRIISIYKSMISAMLVDNVSKKVKSPFIRLNLVCPMGSYDHNVEPSKDDVLFEDEEGLLSLVEGWFRSVYGDRIRATIASNKASKKRDEACDTARSTTPFETLIVNVDALCDAKLGNDIFKAAITVDEDATGVHNSASEAPSDCEISDRMGLPSSPGFPDALPTVDQPRSGFNMSQDYLDEVELDEVEQASAYGQMTADNTGNKQTSRNFHPLNPWVITKLNGPVVKAKTQEPNLLDLAGNSTGNWSPSIPFVLHTPRGSSISRPSPEFRNRRSIKRRSYDTLAVVDTSQRSIEGWLQQNREVSCNDPTPIYDVPLLSPESLDREGVFEEMGSAVIDRDMSLSMLRSPPTTEVHLAPRVTRDVNRPFVSPLRDAHLAFPSATDIRVKGLPSHRPQSNAHIDRIVGAEAQNCGQGVERRLEVQEALDFERRKEAVTRKLRQQLRRSQLSAEVASTPKADSTTLSPQNNRYDAAVAASETNQNLCTIERTKDKMLNKTCLSDNDPRAYFMRTQKSIAACSENPHVGRKLKRTKTILLPLETIPDRTELHSLYQVVSTDIDLVQEALLTLASHDQYAKSGKQAKALPMSTADIKTVEVKLEDLVKRWAQVTEIEEINIVFDLGALQGRSVVDAEKARISGCM